MIPKPKKRVPMEMPKRKEVMPKRKKEVMLKKKMKPKTETRKRVMTKILLILVQLTHGEKKLLQLLPNKKLLKQPV